VEAIFKAVKAPEVEFLQDKATFKGALALTLNIARATEPEKYNHEATAAVDVSGALKVRIHESRLYAQVVVEEVIVKIDEEHNKKWEDKIKNTIRKAVEQSVNDILMRGIALNKRLFGAGLADPVIKFAPGTLQAQTAFDFDARTSSESKEGKN
jgi:predicted phage-related endonuclease